MSLGSNLVNQVEGVADPRPFPYEKLSLEISSNAIHYKECFLTGSHGSVPRQYRLALDLLASGRIEGERYITCRFSLNEIYKALEAARAKQGLKVIVNP